MKHCRTTIFTIAIISNTIMAAYAIPNTNTFSPYADLTINARWDAEYQDMEPMDLVAISKLSGAKSFHLAFITDAGSCSPAWGGQATYSVTANWGMNLTKKLRNNAINYIVSFGGASGNDLSMACNETQLISAIEQVITTYQPNGLDFDIENGSANVAKLMSALKQVQSHYQHLKISFTLPVLPEGLVASGKEIVNQAKAQGLNYSVNIMAMDYGPAYTNAMGVYAIQAANNLFNFLKEIYPEKSESELWKMIEVTPMIGVNDVNVEQFTLDDVDTLRDFAKQKMLGGLAMWSIARDNPCEDKWASPICSGNHLQSMPYEFTQRFGK